MKKMNDTVKSRLVYALLEAEGAELVNTECTSVPSNAFSQRIRRLAEHPEKYTKKHRIKKIVIILIAAAVLLTGCTAIKPVRTAIANFIITVFEKYSSVDKSTDANAKDRITEFYTPGFIPEGYEFAGEEIEKINDSFITLRELKYNNVNNELRFTQLVPKQTMTLNTENTELKTVSIGDIECMNIMNMGRSDFIWEQNGYRFLLSVPDEIDLETAKKIIESVEKIEFTNN